MLYNHGTEESHDFVAGQQQAGVGRGLRRRPSLWQRLKRPTHAKVDVQHHCPLAIPKEVEEVLPMALYSSKTLLIDGFSS